MALGSWPNRPADAQDRQPDGARIQRLPLGPAARCLHGSWSGSPRALFFQPLFLQICLFVFRARGIADRLHAGDIGIRDIRQILNPLRDIRHALHRREVQAEPPPTSM